MINQLEIEDYFIKKLQGMAISSDFAVPILNKHLKGYVLDGRQLGIASNKFPAGIDQFTEVQVIHSGTIRYRRPYVMICDSWRIPGVSAKSVFGEFKVEGSNSFRNRGGSQGTHRVSFQANDFQAVGFWFLWKDE